MKKINFAIFICAISMLFSLTVGLPTVSAVKGEELTLQAKSAVLVDAQSGKLLFEQNSKEHRPIASMVKIMTLDLAFDAIERGELEYSEKITVSENASSMGGSQAYLDAHAEYSAEELIKSIIVASANDACVAIAERLCGSVSGFVDVMNTKAQELGMYDTNFVNCTGLPTTNQYSCAYDSAIMFRDLIRHQKYFEFANIYTFDFVHPSGRTTMLTNTNKLVRFYEGCDGGKTGFTNEAMFCLSATAKRGDTRFIAVVMGSPSAKERNRQICELFDYAFAHYESKQVVFEGVALDKIVVSGAKEGELEIVADCDAYVLKKRGDDDNYSTELKLFDVPVPLKKGDVVGNLVIKSENDIIEVPVVANNDLSEKNFFDVTTEIISRW